jgi:cell division cycle protein 20 (cofactor of APC complex)
MYPVLAQGATPKKQYHRHISNQPARVLDAPEIANNFYLNILDWGANNILAVALGNDVYCWNETTHEVFQLPSTTDLGVTSVSWQGWNYLAVGVDNGDIQLWDIEHQKRVRTLHGHSARVGVLAWNDYILSSGSRDTRILNHDVRIPEHHIATLAHQNEVCGLKWSIDGSQLASGGNDNMAHVWDVRNTRSHQRGTPASVQLPLYSLPHMGAVKALAWCPFQSNLLATGGGSSDRSIRFWSSGTLINTINTSSQVCQLLWSTNYRELVSAHGYSSNSLAVWKYPSLTKVATLEGHMDRVLYLSLSPDGETCVSGAGDETLRFWKIFERASKGSSLKSKQTPINNKHTMIR